MRGRVDTIETPERIDVLEVALNLRKIDQKEAYLFTGMDPKKAVLESYQGSRKVKVVKAKGKCLALFGINGFISDRRVGLPWMVATPDLKDYRMDVFKYSKVWLKWLAKDYDFLTNFCLPENTQSIKWLERLGFTFYPEAEPLGYFKHPFIPFFMQTIWS